MPLADLAAAMKTDLEDGLTKLHTVLDEHMPQLEQLVAIADHELMQKVEQAIPVVPPQILSGIGTMLDAVIAEHAKPEEGPAEAAQAAAAEPQQVEQPAALWSPSPPSPARSQLTVPVSMSPAAS